MYKLPPLLGISIILCILISGCSRKNRFFRRKLYFIDTHSTLDSLQSNPTKPTITIWIHGARPFKANTYNLGLKSPTLFNSTNELAKIADTLIKSDPIKFPLDHFYIFSWSGAMDFSERQNAAFDLHNQIIQLIDSYKAAHGIIPKIRIIAHSHGGNVALDLAAVQNNQLIIDELILLAIPVQSKNKEFVSCSLFKRVFSLYSTIDYAQIIDPQGMYHNGDADSFFSGQRFKPSPNLMQVKTKLNGTAYQHLQFNDLPTLKILSPLIDQLNEWMNEIPTNLLTSDETRFMLSVYTNGRKPPHAKCYHMGGPHEHIELKSACF